MIGSGSSVNECLICFNQFNTSIHIPMLLCLNQHNVCKQCLQHLKDTCPLCRKKIDLKEIFPNRFMLERLEIVQRRKERAAIKQQEKRGRGYSINQRVKNNQEKQKDSIDLISNKRASSKGVVRKNVEQKPNQNKQNIKTNYYTELLLSKKIVVPKTVTTPLQEPKLLTFVKFHEDAKVNKANEDQTLPEVTIRDIKVPKLPNAPNVNMSSKELLALAKKTYQLFGIKVQEKDIMLEEFTNASEYSIVGNPSATILWHFSGQFYMGGRSDKGQKQGQGLCILSETQIYKGQYLDGQQHGRGIYKFQSGDIYDGEWVEGLKEGKGTYFYSQSNIFYSGNWKKGKKHGKGYYKYQNGKYYYGTYVNGEKTGYGTELYKNESSYKGYYKDGLYHGKGKYTWDDGTYYEGDFVNNKYEGKGKMTFAGGGFYQGQFKADEKHGFGKYCYSDGDHYQGEFFHGQKHGMGKLTYKTGKETIGIWEKDKLKQEIQ